MRREVVVTGLGAVTSVGASAPATWSAVRQGESGVGAIERFDPDEYDLRARIAAETSFDPGSSDTYDERTMGRYSQLALAAALEAVDDAGLDPDGADWTPERVGTSIATGLAGLPEIESAAGGRPNPRFLVTALSNLAAGHVSMTLDAKGPNRAPATACAAGTHAIADAVADVRRGRADVVLAGGTDAPISPLGVGGFDAMRALSTRNDRPEAASRPFDADRDGFVLAEGSGCLVLESRDHAVDRGATSYAEISGFGLTADAYDATRPPEDAEGLGRAVERALDDAGRDPAAVDHVNAHATSTPRGDESEARAIRSVFDEPPAVTAPKSVLGHSLGAAGAIEAVLVAKTIESGTIPPTTNLETLDDDCDVPVVTEPRDATVDVAVSTSAGFGGTNGALVFEVDRA